MASTGKSRKQPLIHLRPWRFLRAFSSAELAAASGLTLTTISKIENRHNGPSPVTVRKLAAALGCMPSQLYIVPADVAEAMRDADELRKAEEAARRESMRALALMRPKRYPLAGDPLAGPKLCT